MPGKYKIVMIRHGESEWNQKNLFCGWFDADLSDKGKIILCESYILETVISPLNIFWHIEYAVYSEKF